MIIPGTGDSTVVLAIPMRAEFVSIARLTAAGVANRLGFDIETIEDIKVSLSEVCNRIINTRKKTSNGDCLECKIEFISSSECLKIDFFVENMESFDFYVTKGASPQKTGGYSAGIDIIKDGVNADNHTDEDYEDQLQLSLITILMDEFVVNPSENCLVSMKKYLN